MIFSGNLPGDLRSSPLGQPCWFGTDENNPPFLCYGWEPPWGVTIEGVISEEDWVAWDTAFREQAYHLPHYEIDTEDEAFLEENKHLPKVWVGT